MKTRLGVAHLVTGNWGFKGADFLLPPDMNVSANASLCNLFKFRNIDSTFSGKEIDRHMEQWIPFTGYIKTCTRNY